MLAKTMILVIIPTYNERENLPALCEKIFSLGIDDLHCLVVDDNSPDGTAAVADDLAKRFPITLLKRPHKEGLGRAYQEAFGYALARFSEATHIIQMDADLSHDPADIPRLLAASNVGGADLILASRYAPGGGIHHWHWARKLVSRFGNAYARWVLWLPYRDLTGGFKCWRREALAALDLHHVHSLGYNFQIETTYQAHHKGFRIREVPIIFTERRAGVSKFNLGIILESFWNVLTMRFDKRLT